MSLVTKRGMEDNVTRGIEEYVTSLRGTEKDVTSFERYVGGCF